MQARIRNFTLTVISGGQTGVDRAALDVALLLQIPCGGWCPLGRLAEDGPIPNRYPLCEAGSAKVELRTELNVIDSDGTLILSVGTPTDGTDFTIACAKRYKKPHLVIDLADLPAPAECRTWFEAHEIRVLNVAGPRESHRPGFVYRVAFDFLNLVFSGGVDV